MVTKIENLKDVINKNKPSYLEMLKKQKPKYEKSSTQSLSDKSSEDNLIRERSDTISKEQDDDWAEFIDFQPEKESSNQR